MGARKSIISPTCWAVSGLYEGFKYDGINVTPLLERERILFTITTESGELRIVDEVFFPLDKQSKETLLRITKRVAV